MATGGSFLIVTSAAGIHTTSGAVVEGRGGGDEGGACREALPDFDAVVVARGEETTDR